MWRGDSATCRAGECTSARAVATPRTRAASHAGAAAAAGRPGDHRRQAEVVMGSGKYIVSLCSTGAVLRHANANTEIPRRYDDLV